MSTNKGNDAIRRDMHADVMRKTFSDVTKLHKEARNAALVKRRKQRRTHGKALTQAKDEIADYLARNPVKYW